MEKPENTPKKQADILTEKQRELVAEFRHGDHARFCKILKVSRNYLYLVRKGERKNKHIWEFIAAYMKERERLEAEQIKNIIP